MWINEKLKVTKGYEGLARRNNVGGVENKGNFIFACLSRASVKVLGIKPQSLIHLSDSGILMILNGMFVQLEW